MIDLSQMKVNATNSSDIVEKKSHKKIENVAMMRRELRNTFFKYPQCLSLLSSINNQILDDQSEVCCRITKKNMQKLTCSVVKY